SSAWVPLGGASGGGGAGAGTIDYLAKWATGTTLGNSQIFDNGTNVGVGTATAAAKFQVQANSGRQFTTTNGWADLSSTSNGNGLIASNAYLDQSDGLFKHANSNGSIGATGFVMNYPSWNSASIFVNNGPSTSGLSFAPSRVITFFPNATQISGTLDVSGDTNLGLDLNVTREISAGGTIRATNGLTTSDIYLTTLAGSGSATNICRASATGFLGSCSSSLVYKENIRPLNGGLQTLSKMKPVTFDWRSTHERDAGFIAEEVEKISPLFITRNGDGTVEGVKYSQLSVLAIAAIQEQQEQIESLKRIVCQDHPTEALCR
ncbi:tail fiber domain-containing protein, partial [Candidatus Nomurabacteria bacterium]|nr:tail fiber domain-containing protein [Candidatus Nomurabacteria bacterium]